MKLIKLLVTLSLINAVIVVGIAQYMSRNQATTSPSPSIVASPTPSTSPIATPAVSPAPTNKPSSSLLPKPNSSVAPKTVRCIITIDGVSYEITKLRQTHSGGDIFKCGTDMSVLFWKKHDQQILDMMQQYKI